MFELAPLDLQLLFAVAVAIAAIWLLNKYDRKKALFKLIPGPYKYPIIGTSLEFNCPNEDFYDLVIKFASTYGDRYMLYGAGFYMIVLKNPDDVEKLLTSSVHITKGTTYRLLMPWLGQGLLTSTGEKWQKRRKLLTPSFHFRILEDFLVIFNEQSQILVDILHKEFSNREANDICKYITRCTLDVISESAMNIKLNSQLSSDSPYLRAVGEACEIQAYRAVRPQIWPDFIFNLTRSGRKYNAALKTLHAFTDTVIKERKELRSVKKEEKPDSNADEVYWHGKKRLAFLDLLLDAQEDPENDLSDLDIREEVDTFMFEGHDTTSASLNWTIFLLGCYQEYQSKVHEELDEIFGEDKTRPITPKDLAEMKYLEACIKEALRLYPSVPFLIRQLTSDLVLDDKVTVPAGYDVALCTMPIHQNEKHFPDPEVYLPDRFLGDNGASRHPFAYIPFSAGPRNCIGQKFALMEEKTILANIFRNFKVEAAEPVKNVVVMVEIITRPRDGLRVRMQPR